MIKDQVYQETLLREVLDTFISQEGYFVVTQVSVLIRDGGNNEDKRIATRVKGAMR
jgi:hypothetical protein